MMCLHNTIHKSNILIIRWTRIRRMSLGPIIEILWTSLSTLNRNVSTRRLHSRRWMKSLSRIPMIIIQGRWPKLIRWSTLWSSFPHVVPCLLLWIGHRVQHANNLIQLTTFVRMMVSPIIATTITLTFGPTLILCMPPSTTWMKLLLLHVLTTLTSMRRSHIVFLAVLRLSLTSLVLWRWTTVSSLITVLPTSTKLTSVARLATLNTPQPRYMSPRLNRRRSSRLLILNHQRYLVRKTLHLLNHCLLKSQLTSTQHSLYFLKVRIRCRGR